jgi:hypothetical protein
LTLVHLFILEYTDEAKLKSLHVFSWIATLFGIFFVLAGTEKESDTHNSQLTRSTF